MNVFDHLECVWNFRARFFLSISLLLLLQHLYFSLILWWFSGRDIFSSLLFTYSNVQASWAESKNKHATNSTQPQNTSKFTFLSRSNCIYKQFEDWIHNLHDTVNQLIVSNTFLVIVDVISSRIGNFILCAPKLDVCT